MAIDQVRCPVTGAIVSRVVDLEGETTKIICGEYDKQTGMCRLKKSVSKGGMLSQLFERVSEDSLNTRNTRCVLG